MPVRRICSAWYLAIHDLPPGRSRGGVELGVEAVADKAAFPEGKGGLSTRAASIKRGLGAELERGLESATAADRRGGRAGP